MCSLCCVKTNCYSIRNVGVADRLMKPWYLDVVWLGLFPYYILKTGSYINS